MFTKINDMDLKVLSLFTKGYDCEYYIREVEKLCSVSSRTALVTLSRLEKRGILVSKMRGKIKSYTIKKSILSRDFFILVEQYKKIHFLEKNQLLKEVFEKSDKFLDGVVLVFGSYAKELQKEDSDVDLFVIGKYDEKKIKEVGKKYGLVINIKSYPMNIFKKELRGDVLLTEILKNHILIKDADGFVRVVMKWIK